MMKPELAKKRKVLLSALVLAAAGAVTSFGVYSAFTATTANSGNTFASGTVKVDDNDSGSVMYSTSDLKPNDTVERCITVTSTGSLDATVKIYGSSVASTLGNDINLKVRPGSGTVAFGAGCSGFTPDGVDLYDGTLSSFPVTYALGVTDLGPGSNIKWVNNDSVVYRFTLTLSGSTPDSSQGEATGAHTFTWEARNQ